MKTHADVASYIDRSIHLSGKTNQEIAGECGLAQGSFISMIRRGHTALPIARVHAFARATQTEPAILFKGCLAAYFPELHDEFERLAPIMLISQREIDHIHALRSAGYFT